MKKKYGMPQEEAQKYFGKRVSIEPTTVWFEGDYEQVSYDRTIYAKIVGYDDWNFDVELETADERDGQIVKVTSSRVRGQLKDRV